MAYTVAPRSRACDADSRTSIPAPSPSTNPSLALSNGRDARSGSSLRVDIARMTANAPMFSGMMAASVPPVRTTSAPPGGTLFGGGRPAQYGHRADVQRHDGRLSAAGQDHVGPARADHVDGVPDRLRPGGAGAHQGMRGRVGAELHADPAGL